MTAMIEVTNLQKDFKVYRHHPGFIGAFQNIFDRQFRLVHAVDGLTFTLQPGELVGYLGPNGAGKSTTIKILTGLLAPTAGKVIVNGQVPWRDRTRYVRQVGAVFGQRTSLWWDLPVIESFSLHQHIYGIPAARFQHNLATFRKVLDLDPFINTPVRSLSLGQRMRADLCAALLHDPILLFLDEPTIGLDVVAKEHIRQFIQFTNREQGTTVILTTHDLSDVEKLCERVLIIDQGKLLFDGSLDALTSRFGGKRALEVDFSVPYPDPQVEGAELTSSEGLHAVYHFEREQASASDLIIRLSTRYRIQDLRVREPDIEDTIRRIYEQRLLYN